MEPSESSSQLSRISSASSVTSHDDIVEKWFEIDDSVSIDVPKQSLEEILSDTIVDFDDDVDLLSKDEDTFLATGSQAPSISYNLDSPLCLKQLESISYQLKSHYERGGGRANCIDVSSSAIAVGTTRGRILIFNRSHQRLEASLFIETCPVSSLSFNRDGTKLAVAFAIGKVVVMHVASGEVLTENSEVVQLGRGILQIVMLGRGHRMIVVDSGGSVYIYEPPRRFRSSRVKCVFSGARGEVIFVKTIVDERAIALVSLTKLYIITFPECRLIYLSPCTGPANRPPLIDWQYLDFKFFKGDFISPVVCVARGTQVSFYRLISGNNGFEKAAVFRTLPLDFEIINLKWIDYFHIVAVSVDEKLHLVDISQGKIAEEDISSLGLVYGTAEFKGLSVGGNVSAALQYMADSTCYQSVCRNLSYIVLLGQYAVFTLHISDQISQLDAFIERNDIVAAVAYAVDLYTEKIQNKKLGLKHDISSRFPFLINKLLAKTTGLGGGNIGKLVEHYKVHVPLLIWSCVKTSHFDLLYNTVYPVLEKDALSKAQFMEVLDEVVNEGLFEDPPPVLVKDYFEYLIFEGHLSQFEAAVIRIPPEKQDLDFAVKECKKNKLFDGLIHLSYVALNEYTFPLEIMFENVHGFGDSEVLSDCQVEQSNKLFLYLQCCLTGQAYPAGSLPVEIAKNLPINVYRCLVSRFGKSSSSALETYPYIRLLLKLDGKQFLDVLFTSSDSPVFTFDVNRMHKLLDIIYEVLLPSDNHQLKAHFLVFVTHLIHSNAISVPLHMIKALVDAVLSNEMTRQRHPEVESAIIELMTNVFGLDENHILSLAKRNSYLQVCAYIYSLRRQFTELIDCYVNDKFFANDVFFQIRNLLGQLSESELQEFTDYLRSSLMKLNTISAFLTAEIVVDYFLDWLRDADDKSDGFAQLVYNCFLIRRSKGWRDLTGKDKVDDVLFSRAVEHFVSEGDSLRQDKQLVDFIRYWLPIGSLSDRTLNHVVKQHFALSSAVLFEARGFYNDAFQTLYSELEKWSHFEAGSDNMVSDFKSRCESATSDNYSFDKSEHLVKEILRLASLHHIEASEGEWLLKILLLILTLPESELDGVLEEKFHLNMIISGIIESGSSSIENLVNSLLAHPVFSNACYHKFRSFIDAVFASCRYEVTLLELTVKCIEEENLDKMSSLIKRKTERAAGLITSVQCILCGKPPSKSAFIFSCGHLMHLQCEAERQTERKCPCSRSMFKMDDGSETLHRINPRIGTAKYSSLFSEDNLKLCLGPRS